MKYLALALLSLPLYANDELLRQLGTSERAEDLNHEFQMVATSASSQSLKISFDDCKRADEQRQQTPMNLQAVLYYGKLCSQSTSMSEGKVVGFNLQNETKNAINPRTAAFESTRTYNFEFPQRHVHNAHISITENSGLTSQMSHDFLETTLVLLPRKVIPSIEVFQFNGEQFRRITLVTSETIDVKTVSGEIVDGVFKELPMDMTPSRHDRKFVGLEYQGRGIMIRVDRRAGTPEHIYTQSFNRHERIKDATLTHQGKTCYVPKELIWVNAEDADKGVYLRYSSDQEFLDRVVNPRCRWNLSLSDLE